MSSKDEIAIKVSGVSKSFKLPHEKNTSVKSFITHPFRKRTFEKQEVLKDINFEIKKGEFFGIVGRNGSGKSTLLKLLAGIYSPDKGHIQINGKLTPFIELGVGFNPELTGRENVYLNGALLGFNRKEMSEMYEEIVEFAELEKFMDQKLKNYSSGMQVRLAFSIAIKANSEILVLDEVLAVGDSSFQRKCFEYFVLLKKQKKTVVLVTHDMAAVERFCDVAIVINNGEITGKYTPSQAASEYDKLNASENSEIKTEDNLVSRWGTKKVTLDEIQFEKNLKTEKKLPVYQMGDEFQITLRLNNPDNLNYIAGISIQDAYGVNLSGPNSKSVPSLKSDKLSYNVKKLPLLPGEYKVTVAVFDEHLIEEYDHFENTHTFRVVADQHDLYGKVNLFGEWKV
jgi:ABC-2 type transport system ATP-binding protein